jgi:hypothetical protein
MAKLQLHADAYGSARRAARNNRRAGKPHAINRASNKLRRRNIGGAPVQQHEHAPEAIHDRPAQPGLAQGHTALEWTAVGQDSVVPASTQTTARPLAAPRRPLPLVACAGLPPFRWPHAAGLRYRARNFCCYIRHALLPRDYFLTSPANSSASSPLTIRSVLSLLPTNTIIN